MSHAYDALLLVSFGGPEGREDVIPFLENVLRGKDVPRQRLLEVAEHYYHFQGVSPINAQNRALVAELEHLLAEQGPPLPVYWGNRNWHPLLPDTLRRMQAAGVRRALAFVTSIFGCYSGCRQYREDLEQARADVGPGAPVIDKIRCAFNHPDFIAALAERVQAAVAELPAALREDAQLVFTAHSIPLAMAQSSPYVEQLQEACRLVGQAAGRSRWSLVFQSRSGPPHQPWLEPDVVEHLRAAAASGGPSAVVLAPIGFVSDHMEVLYDLDTEARQVCAELGLPMVRAATVGTHPRFIAMIRRLVLERVVGGERLACGTFAAAPDVCPADCCPPPAQKKRGRRAPGL